MFSHSEKRGYECRARMSVHVPVHVVEIERMAGDAIGKRGIRRGGREPMAPNGRLRRSAALAQATRDDFTGFLERAGQPAAKRVDQRIARAVHDRHRHFARVDDEFSKPCSMVHFSLQNINGAVILRGARFR